MNPSTTIWDKIEYSTLGTTIAESTWMFPTLETIHVICLVSVLGTIFVVDLRMLGWTSNKFAVTLAAKDTCRGPGALSSARRSPAACCGSARRRITCTIRTSC